MNTSQANKLKLVNSYSFPQESAPCHLVFADNSRLYLDLEISSELASMNFNPETGKLALLDKISTLSSDFKSPNEPAEIRLHSNGRFLYVKNRSEDAIVWFRVDEKGKLAKSIYPGLASRSFAFSPDEDYLVSADRPDNKIKVFHVDGQSGALEFVSDFNVPQPAFIAFATH